METYWHCSFTDPWPLHSHTPRKPFWDFEVRKGQILRFVLGETMIVLPKRLKTTGYCYFFMYQKGFHTKCRASVLGVFLEKDPAWGVACSSFGPEKLNLLQLWQQRRRKGVSEQKVCRQLPLHLTHTCTGRRTEDLTYWQASQSWHPSTLPITSKDTDGLKAVAKGILGQRVRVGVSERRAGGLSALH